MFKDDFGQGTITDFDAGHTYHFWHWSWNRSVDTIQVDIGGFDSFDDLDISQNGDDALLDFGDDNTLTLTGVNVASLTHDDFVFV